MNKLLYVALFGSLMSASARTAQVQSNSYSFKGNALGMPLSDFKQANATDADKFSVELGGKIYKKVSLPFCSDTVPGLFTNLPEGVVGCTPYPEALHMKDIPPSAMVMDIPLMSIHYLFYKDRLYKIEMVFMANFFSKVEQSFVDRYGSPKDVTKTLYTNALGARWNGSNVLWSNGQQEIVMVEGAGGGPSITTGAVNTFGYEHPSTITFSDKSLSQPVQNKQTPNF